MNEARLLLYLKLKYNGSARKQSRTCVLSGDAVPKAVELSTA